MRWVHPRRRLGVWPQGPAGRHPSDLRRHARGWWPSLKGAGDAVAAVVAVLALGVTAGRALFWASPLFGRLHLRNDDNPLGEISATVARHASRCLEV